MQRLVILSIALLFSLSSLDCYCNPVPLSLAVNSPGTPPHLYFDDSQKRYVGVIPDLLALAVENGEISVTYLDSHRNRNENYLYSGDIDSFVSSLDWLKHPEKVIASRPVFVNTSYLYSLTPFSRRLENESFSEELVCARRGYSYPYLSAFFDDGKLHRVDSSSHLTMLKMLEKKRCDIAVMAESNFNSLKLLNEFKHLSFYRSSEPISTVELSLIFHPSKLALKELLDKYIEYFISSGELEASLEKHRAILQNKSLSI